MEAMKSDARDPTVSSSLKNKMSTGQVDAQITCSQKDSAGSSCEHNKHNGKETGDEISDELRDRLCLKSVNGLIVNGLDTHKTKNPSPPTNVCGESSSQTNSSTNNVDSVSDSAPYNSEESSGYSSSHEESRLSKVQRRADDNSGAVVDSAGSDIRYVSYESELQMPDIMRLIQKDLSEPYSIYTYRYFIHNWPKLCFLAMCGDECVGAIVCKLDLHRKIMKRGYIAMLAVDEKHRKKRIGSNLVLKAIRAMVADDADEVVLETEITNRPALRLYENLGFVRDKRLFRYYLNGVDALRLKLWLR